MSLGAFSAGLYLRNALLRQLLRQLLRAGERKLDCKATGRRFPDTFRFGSFTRVTSSIRVHARSPHSVTRAIGVCAALARKRAGAIDATVRRDFLLPINEAE